MPANPDFEAVLAQLRDTSRPYSMATLYVLSDLAPEDLSALQAAWSELPDERRANIIHNLDEIAEHNFEVTFEAVFRLGLDDASAAVRASAIRGLWESEDPSLIVRFLDAMHHDEDLEVRAAAASALGRFVYLGELEELPSPQARRVEDALLEVITGDDDLEVRRRALEAVAYSSRPEVPPLIAEAYASSESKMRVSAVFAMGRNADARRWADTVRAELDSPEAEMRFEAARAAGELELTACVRALANLTRDADVQVQEAAIWSLGQIGGKLARHTLNRLYEETDDEDQQEFILEALDNLNFTDEVNTFSLMELGEDGTDGLDELDEWDDEDFEDDEFDEDDEDDDFDDDDEDDE